MAWSRASWPKKGAEVLPSGRRTAVTLVTGASSGAREAAVALRVDAQPGVALAALFEGLPDGQARLLPSPTFQIHRVAPACFCCTGNLVLRVTLNRILRFRPEHLYIGLATTEHLDQLRSWLQAPPYDQLLELSADLRT